jgi:ABC-type sugar transport system ATPase subunit
LKFKNLTIKNSKNISLDNLEIKSGTVHAILGEELSGKASILKMLSGSIKPTSGKIIYNNESVEFDNFEEALNKGIFMIHQQKEDDENKDIWGFLKKRSEVEKINGGDFFSNMSIAENIFLGREPTVGFGFLQFISSKKLYKKTRYFLEKLDIALAPELKMDKLNNLDKLLVALAKALSYQAKLIIIDEPTKLLTQKETAVFFEKIKIMKEKDITFIYLSREIDVILKISDYVSVFKNGNIVGSMKTDNADFDKLALMLLGKNN